jgi:hypothetical protein
MRFVCQLETGRFASGIFYAFDKPIHCFVVDSRNSSLVNVGEVKFAFKSNGLQQLKLVCSHAGIIHI